MKLYWSVFLAVVPALMYGQEPEETSDEISRPSGGEAMALMEQGDSLRMEYRFAESVEMYEAALAATGDSLERLEIDARILLSENGLSMTGFVGTPSIVARHRFSVRDFYLFYPLEDNSWVPVPNLLDTLGTNPFSRATYVPEGAREIYFSAPDATGAMNIYYTEDRDTVWSLPVLLNEGLVSSSDEICPMLSGDGKTLYFASSGLYGVGGYDIYMSSWDDSKGEWGTPVNMGFPYSSPYNDFLYAETPDGRYTLFASDRDCPPDSVDVYVLDYDNMPVRKPVTDVRRLKEICSMNPEDNLAGGTSSSDGIPENVDTRRYMAQVDEVKALKDSLYRCMSSIDADRSRIAISEDEDEHTELASRISANELLIPQIQASLDSALAVLQKIEMEFLFNGVVLDPDRIIAEADREVVGASSGFAFARMSPRENLDIDIEEPEKEFDYSFMVLPEGRFAENNVLPDGLVYQIQIFTLSRKARTAELNGLSPVFEYVTPTGKYTYRVGVFRTYNDVLSRLNDVKKAGFRTAYVVPLNDGEVIKMAEAKALEAKNKVGNTGSK